MVEIALKQYAVRVKGTQMYLPRPQRADGRGGSHLEPIDFAVDPSEWPVRDRYRRNMQIRLWTTRSAAKNALTSWQSGAVGCSRGGDQYDGYYEDIYLVKKPHRKDIEMEIVEIRLVLPE